MKAWLVGTKTSDYCTVVFAETRGKAKDLARRTDACDGARYLDITARRATEIEKYYKEGKVEMDWSNPEDRAALVKELGFVCLDADEEDCRDCLAKQYCAAFNDYYKEEFERNKNDESGKRDG